VCPHRFATSGTCDRVSEIEDLSVGGVLTLDGVNASYDATGTLISDQSPECGSSCADIEADFDDPAVSCEPGTNDVACRCQRPFELGLDLAFALPTSVGISTSSDELLMARYCQDGDSMTLSAPDIDLRFERADCRPGDAKCVGRDVQECSPDGVPVTRSCPPNEGCFEGRCIPGCEPGELYCNGDAERRCGADGLQFVSDAMQPCAPGVACSDGACQGPRVLLLGLDLGGGSLDNVAFAGEVIEVTESATLISYAFTLNTYDDTPLAWQVYEALGPAGPFQLVSSATSPSGPGGGEQSAPPLSVPLVQGRYYLLGVGVPPSAIFMSGEVLESGIYARPLGVIWSQTPLEDGFNAGLAAVPRALVGRALFER
jgi:hypothetical protein